MKDRRSRRSFSGGGAGGAGVSDHGALTGLGDDDHPQYLTPAEGDAAYDAIGAAAAAQAASLAKSANLSDLASAATARTNLDVYSSAQVDALIASIPSKAVSNYATAAALPSCTYANGTSGVGATLTGTANGALVVDGQLVAAGNTVLVQNQASNFQNGPYIVTQPGVAAVSPFILTRRSDYDTAAEMAVAATFPVDSEGLTPGSTNDAKVFLSVTTSPFVVGTTGITFAQVGGTYTAAGGIQLSGNQFSLAASPALTGNPTAPTPAAADNDTSIATTAYVQGELTLLNRANYATRTYARATFR